MRKKIGGYIILLGLWMMGINHVQALNMGDIVITTANMDAAFSTGGCPNPTSTNNAFEFLTLVDIATGTNIKFTDNGRTGTGWRTTEGTLVFTAANLIPAGTLTYYNDCNIMTQPTVWSRVGGWDPTTAGDTLIAYQGPIHSTGANFLYGIGRATATPWISSGSITANNSYLPPGMVLGLTAIQGPGSFKNITYSCNVKTNIYESNILSVLSNTANRSGSSSTGFGSIGGFCSFIPQYDIDIQTSLIQYTGNYLPFGYVNIGFPVGFQINVMSIADTGYNIHIHDLLPAGLNYLTSSVTTGTYNEISGEWDIGKLGSGINESLYIYATLSSGGGTYTNTGELLSGYSGIEINGVNNQSSTMFSGIHRDFSGKLTAPSLSQLSGSEVMITFDYQYNGTLQASGIAGLIIPTGFIPTLPNDMILSGDMILTSPNNFIPSTGGTINITGIVVGNSGDTLLFTGFIVDTDYCFDYFTQFDLIDQCIETVTGNNISNTYIAIGQGISDLSIDTIAVSPYVYGTEIITIDIYYSISTGSDAGGSATIDLSGTSTGIIWTPNNIFVSNLQPGNMGVVSFTGIIGTGFTSGTTLPITATINNLYMESNLIDNVAYTNTTTINKTPIANNDSYTGMQDTTLFIIPVLVNDTSVDGDNITINNIIQGSHTTAISSGSMLIVQTINGYCGNDILQYDITDGVNISSVASVSISIQCNVLVVTPSVDLGGFGGGGGGPGYIEYLLSQGAVVDNENTTGQEILIPSNNSTGIDNNSGMYIIRSNNTIYKGIDIIFASYPYKTLREVMLFLTSE